MSDDEKLEDMRWVRLFSPIHIPPYLVEQLKTRNFEVQDFFRYQEANCLMEGDKGPTLNPFNHLYALVNPQNIVRGFFWATIDPLSKDLLIQSFSVAKQFWHQGKAIEKLVKHVKEMQKKLELKKVFWLTTTPKHGKKYGFKPSKHVLMEYIFEEEKKNGINPHGEHHPERKHQPTESPTAEAV